MTQRAQTLLIWLLSAIGGSIGCYIGWEIIVAEGPQFRGPIPASGWLAIVLCGTILGWITGVPTGLPVRAKGPPEINQELGGCCALVTALVVTPAVVFGLMLYAYLHLNLH